MKLKPHEVLPAQPHAKVVRLRDLAKVLGFNPTSLRDRLLKNRTPMWKEKCLTTPSRRDKGQLYKCYVVSRRTAEKLVQEKFSWHQTRLDRMNAAIDAAIIGRARAEATRRRRASR
jgi:hypothetical protein